MYETSVGYFVRCACNSVKWYNEATRLERFCQSGRIILKAGRVVDPKNKVDSVKDISIANGLVMEIADSIKEEAGDIVINCEGLLVVPGLIGYAFLHLGDLFEVSTNPIFCAVEDGVTLDFHQVQVIRLWRRLCWGQKLIMVFRLTLVYILEQRMYLGLCCQQKN